MLLIDDNKKKWQDRQGKTIWQDAPWKLKDETEASEKIRREHLGIEIINEVALAVGSHKGQNQ